MMESATTLYGVVSRTIDRRAVGPNEHLLRPGIVSEEDPHTTEIPLLELGEAPRDKMIP